MPQGINQLTFRDMGVLSELPFHSSLRKLANASGLEAQHLSKIVKGMEDVLEVTLLNRSVKGIVPTPDGIRYARLAKEVLDFMSRAQEGFEKSEDSKTQVLTLGSRVFLNSMLAGVYARLTHLKFNNTRIRAVDGSPVEKEEWARRGLVDLIVSIEKLALSQEWVTQHLGEVEWSFFARRNHPGARSQMSLNELLAEKILIFAQIDGERLLESDVVMGVKVKAKSRGMSVETATTAIAAILNSNQIGLLPVFLVSQLGLQDRLLRIHVDGYEGFRQKVYLACHQDRVSKKFYDSMAQEISSLLCP
jgi:DNA-binding transcriptional LysR family regulator